MIIIIKIIYIYIILNKLSKLILPFLGSSLSYKEFRSNHCVLTISTTLKKM